MLLAAIDYRYPLLMGAALLACTLLLRRSQEKLALSKWEKLAIGLGAFCGAMLGAKLPFVLADWEGLRSGAAWFSDGKTIMCGLVGAYFGVELTKWALEIRVKTGDTFAAPVAVAVGIGRIACFVAGCCFGTPTTLPWGCRFPTAGDDLPRHPTQLYEAAFHFAMAGLLILLRRRGIWRGQLAKFYILTYLGYRFVTEFIRPEASIFAGLTAYQWAALLLTPIFAWLWWRDSEPEASAPGVWNSSRSPVANAPGSP
jgi:phosphatidylglycerol:prolipoprotein diacylglycerol transferase